MLEKIVILDFGGQYNQLIARRVREAGVYCEIMHYATPMETWAGDDLRGVILTGGPKMCIRDRNWAPSSATASPRCT